MKIFRYTALLILLSTEISFAEAATADSQSSNKYSAQYYSTPTKKSDKSADIKPFTTPSAQHNRKPSTIHKEASKSDLRNKSGAESTESSNNRAEKIRKRDLYIKIFSGYAGTRLSSGAGNINTGENTPLFGAAFGKHFSEYFRADLEISHKLKFKGTFAQGALTKQQDFENTTFLLNGYMDWPLKYFDKLLMPFVVGGVGFSANKSYTHTISTAFDKFPTKLLGKTKTDYAWQVGVGTSFFVNKFVDLDISLKYIDRGEAETQDDDQVIKTRIIDKAVFSSLKINL